jgi:DNA modification methylase
LSIEPVKNKELDNETWINWAHGIWTDISETNTLQYYCGRDAMDEKHICPLQLETIERCIKLYSNPGETVLTPFMGIGSEAFVAVKLKRRAIGIELKESYFKVAIQNLKSISSRQNDLFSNIKETAA